MLSKKRGPVSFVLKVLQGFLPFRLISILCHQGCQVLRVLRQIEYPSVVEGLPEAICVPTVVPPGGKEVLKSYRWNIWTTSL